MNIKEFREIGLLQEINRLFLHPLGLALSVEVDENGNEELRDIWDYRNDPEGIIFGENVITPKKIQDVKEFMQKQHKKRKETTGYVIQEK